MDVQAEYQGTKLLLRYGRPYIRFDCSYLSPCELPISPSQQQAVLQSPSLLPQILHERMREEGWGPEKAYETVIVDFLVYWMGDAEKDARKKYRNLTKYPEERRELYDSILREGSPTEHPRPMNV